MNKVLIIDDDCDLLECLRETFLFKGFVVLIATNGQEALDILTTDNVDLILTDIDMPKMSGIEFLKKYRLINSQTPIAVMSGGSKFSKEDILSLGATFFIQKPFQNIELLFQVFAA